MIPWDATPDSSSIIIIGDYVVVAIGSLVICIVVELHHVIGRFIGLKEIGDLLAGFNQDLHEVGGDIGVFVIVKGGCKAFVANACSTSCGPLAGRPR